MAATPNFEKATLVWTLPWDADWVTTVCFTNTSRRLVAGNNLGQMLLWELPETPGGAAPLPIRQLQGHTNSLTRLLRTPDGKSLISASFDHTIRFWDVNTATTGTATIQLNETTRAEAKRRRSSKIPEPISATVAVQPSARVFAGHQDWILGLSLSASGKVLLSGDDAGVVIVWDVESGKELRRWKLAGWAYGLALSPDGKQALIAERVPLVFDSGRQAAVHLWDVTTGKVQHDLSKLFAKHHMATSAYSPDGVVVALGRGGELDGNNGKITFIDPKTGKQLRELTPGHLYGATDVVFHPDGKHLASAGRDTVVRIWNRDGKLLKELGKPRGGQFKDWIHAIAFSPEGNWLAAADMAGSVQVWHFPG